MIGRLSNEDIERARRSIVMLPPTAPAGLSREEAIELLEALQHCRSQGRQLLVALRAVAATVDDALRGLVTSRGSRH